MIPLTEKEVYGEILENTQISDIYDITNQESYCIKW
jgi:hypothetical protein